MAAKKLNSINNERLKALLSITEVGLSSLALDELLQNLISRMVDITKARAGIIWIIDKQTQTLIPKASKGISDRYMQYFKMPAIRTPCFFIAKKKHGHFINSISGLAIGVFRNEEYLPQKITINSDDILLLYTDGLTEARKNGQIYGDTNALNIVSKVADQSAQYIVNSIVNDIIQYTSGKLEADIAIIAFRVQGAKWSLLIFLSK